MIFKQVIPLSLMFVFFSCASGISQKKSKGGFQEDISSFRPKYSPQATTSQEPAQIAQTKDAPLNASADVTAQLNSKLEQIKTNAPKTAKGYRVLLYSGNKKEEATLMKDKAHTLISDKIHLEFKAPNFRVKAGDAIDRLEANYLLGKLRSEFPNAVIVPDEINLDF